MLAKRKHRWVHLMIRGLVCRREWIPRHSPSEQRMYSVSVCIGLVDAEVDESKRLSQLHKGENCAVSNHKAKFIPLYRGALQKL